jgi:hypothetical protein
MCPPRSRRDSLLAPNTALRVADGLNPRTSQTQWNDPSGVFPRENPIQRIAADLLAGSAFVLACLSPRHIVHIGQIGVVGIIIDGFSLRGVNTD